MIWISRTTSSGAGHDRDIAPLLAPELTATDLPEGRAELLKDKRGRRGSFGSVGRHSQRSDVIRTVFSNHAGLMLTPQPGPSGI
jgi:hypothetical protein